MGIFTWYGWAKPYFILGTIFGSMTSIVLLGIALTQLAYARPSVFKIVSDIDRVKLSTSEGPSELLRILNKCLVEIRRGVDEVHPQEIVHQNTLHQE